MWLVVGLGNPGNKYAGHRHNVGFMVVDELAQREDCDSFRSKFSAELARCRLSKADDDALLLKPQTFMNLSGDSVQPCGAFYKVPPQRVIVIHDELDVPFGEVRLKIGGGHGGHNGLRSIIGRMGADFVRIRMGIGRPPGTFRGDVADFVLSNFSAEEQDKLQDSLALARKTVLDIAARGTQAAMKRRNTRTKKKRPKTPAAAKPAAPAKPLSDVESTQSSKDAESLLAPSTIEAGRGQRPGGDA